MTEVSLETPYQTEKIVESYNLFLNSDDNVRNGQNYDFEFGNNTVMTRNKDQYIRLTLLNFNMYKNWTDVNLYNSRLILTEGGTKSVFSLTEQNYSTIHDIANNLANKFIDIFNTFATGTVTATVIAPTASTSITGTTNNVIIIEVEATGGHNITSGDIDNGDFQINAVIDANNIAGLVDPLTNVAPPGGADVGLLLGIDRLPASSTGQSFIITRNSGTKITFTGRYPAQRSTEPNVYMRINPAPQIYASEGFQKPLENGGSNKLNPSSILAEIKIDTEFVQYNPTSDKEYFVNLYQNALAHFQINLTDSRNRGIPYTGNQLTTGNRFFTATLRVDIVQDVAYGQASVANISVPKQFPASKDSNLLPHYTINGGRKTFGKAPGF